MKKTQKLAVVILVAGVLGGLYSCLKTEERLDIPAQNETAEKQNMVLVDRNADDAIPVPCGIWFEGSWGSSTEFGYHVYTDRLLDLSTYGATDVVTVSVRADEVPNRFEIRTLTGTLITDTPWLGASNFEPAPCLTGNVSTNSTADITFVRGANTKVLLRVITCSTSSISDRWLAYYACGKTCPQGNCNDCGKWFSGSWPGPGFHLYDDQVINLTGVPAGAWICIQCNSVEVPNRFDLKNFGPGTSIISTNWIGASNFMPQVCWDVLESSPKTIRFKKQAGYDFPAISIATCPPPNQQDSWLFSVNCDCPPPRQPDENQ